MLEQLNHSEGLILVLIVKGQGIHASIRVPASHLEQLKSRQIGGFVFCDHKVELIPRIKDLVAPGEEGLELVDLEQAKLLLLNYAVVIEHLNHSISALFVSVPDTQPMV